MVSPKTSFQRRQTSAGSASAAATQCRIEDGVEDRVVERRRAEEEGRASFLDRVQDGGGGVPSGVEDGRRTYPVRKGEVVAEAVGMEEACGGERGVALGDAEHLLRVGEARVGDVVLEVDDGFRLAGRA